MGKTNQPAREAILVDGRLWLIRLKAQSHERDRSSYTFEAFFKADNRSWLTVAFEGVDESEKKRFGQASAQLKHFVSGMKADIDKIK